MQAAHKQFEKNENKYPHYHLKDVFPWDADLPVPLVFVTEALKESNEDWEDKVIGKAEKYLLKTFDGTYITNLKASLKDRKISEKLEGGILTILKTQIPIITLEDKHLVGESYSATEDAATLFVRINTGGTRLEGEELIYSMYSMYKTVFPGSKEIVEDAGAGFIAPSRIITLISRIVLTDIGTSNQEGIKKKFDCSKKGIV